MGRRGPGIALLMAELIGLALVVASAILLSDTTWYLVPFLVGMAFIVVWSIQAVAAFLRRAAPAGRHPARTRPLARSGGRLADGSAADLGHRLLALRRRRGQPRRRLERLRDRMARCRRAAAHRQRGD